MIVRQERALTEEAKDALSPAVAKSNITWADVYEIMQGQGWMIWNCGGLSWVFTMINTDAEIEVLLAGGREAKRCVVPWERAMVSHPAHKGLTLRVDGRKGWARLLRGWERRDDVLYLRVA